jgi:hypothetical protein
MDRYGFGVHLTPAALAVAQARRSSRPRLARMAICCAGAGEMSLYPMKEEKAKGRRGLVRLKGGAPIYAARAIFPHLAGREVVLDARKTLGVRRFTSNLPGDFGLRAVMGRLPEPEKTAR